MTNPMADMQTLTVRITTVRGQARDIQLQHNGNPADVFSLWAKVTKADGQIIAGGLVVPWTELAMAEIVDRAPSLNVIPMGRPN